MKYEQLYQPFEIICKTLDECPKLDHQHSFFELVYILEGSGVQCINENTFRYHANHMFLLTPGDCHRFDIEETTRFFFLRFTDIYIKNSGLPARYIEQLEFILHNANHQPGCILKNQSDKLLVRSMIEAIVREQENRDLYDRELVAQLVNTLIVVVTRNILKYLPEKINEYSEERIFKILQYIQNNAFEPANLKVEVISKHFGMSEHYLGKYFRKHTNENLQHYIGQYRVTLIEHRLKHSDIRINEIAYALGFTDESHLNKFFRKNKGLSPTAYRKEARLSA